MNDLQKSITFWILLAVIISGNVVLLIALAQHLFIEPSKDGAWLISVFATEILGSFVFAWKYFFREPEKSEKEQAGFEATSTESVIESSSLQEQITLAGLVKVIPSKSIIQNMIRPLLTYWKIRLTHLQW